MPAASSISAEQIMLGAPAIDAVVDPMTWFPSPGPFEIEIGCGKGGFLLHRARRFPERRLLGVEWANKFYRYCADRMARWGLENVRVMRTDARMLIMQNLPPASVEALHVYHPDPWPKKRHHKRRLFQPDFVEAAGRVLRPSGILAIQTDHAEYWEWIQAVMRASPWFVPKPHDPAEAGDEAWNGTNFEIKYRREGREIYRGVYLRRPDP